MRTLPSWHVNIHIHPVNLDHASRILKGLASAGRSGCFSARTFFGAGPETRYELQDEFGSVHVELLPRGSTSGSSFVRKAVATLSWARRVGTRAKRLPATCVNAHGLSTLALGVRLKRYHGCRLIYDTHELESKALAVRGIRRAYSERLERTLLAHCDAVVCVSDGIADWYESHYDITRPLVVRNVPDRRLQVPASTDGSLRARCGLPAQALVFLYQGGLMPGRQVERFLDVFPHLSPDRHLVFMGRGPLEEAIRTASRQHPNIHYHPAVPPNEVLSCSAQADVGLIGVENRCLSYYLSLPNKLFESLAAGIPVLVPDFPEMRRVVEHHRCGWVWPGGTDGLVSLLQGLSADEVRAKKPYALAAGREYSWEQEEQALLHMYERLVGRATGPVALSTLTRKHA